MSNTSNKDLIADLASSQVGVFTSKQTEAFGIPRYGLSYAAKTGHIERICHGAYRFGLSLHLRRAKGTHFSVLCYPYSNHSSHDG